MTLDLVLSGMLGELSCCQMNLGVKVDSKEPLVTFDYYWVAQRGKSMCGAMRMPWMDYPPWGQLPESLTDVWLVFKVRGIADGGDQSNHFQCINGRWMLLGHQCGCWHPYRGWFLCYVHAIVESDGLGWLKRFCRGWVLGYFGPAWGVFVEQRQYWQQYQISGHKHDMQRQ